MGATVKNRNAENVNKFKTRKKPKRLKTNSIQTFFKSTNGGHNLKLDENIYDCLNVERTKNKPSKPLQNKPKRNDRAKPPPLIVTDKQSNIDEILRKNGISKYNFKIQSIGTKLFLDNTEDFEKISSQLKENKVEHFSYAPKDKKVCKVVLSGLPVIEVETIRDELKSLNIQPELIIQMKTRNPNPHRALYLMHFDGQQIKFGDLQKVKSISHVIVKWSLYRAKNSGPTQCRNCAMYGHGTRNCHRRPICGLCAANDHNQSNCPLNSLPPDSAPVYKCSYCVSNNMQNVNHKANDPNCPARNAYADARKKAAARQRSENQKQNTRLQQNNMRTMPAPPPPPLTRSFNDVVTNDDNTEAPPNNNANEDLFTTTELLQIFTSAINDIRKCRTKLDQIQVITNLLGHVL